MDMTTAAQSGEASPTEKDERIPSQEALGQSAPSRAAAEDVAQSEAAAPASPGQDGKSARYTNRPPIAVFKEAPSREPVGADAEPRPEESARRHQPGERPTRTRFGRRPIIMACAVVLALGVAVCVSSGVFSTGAPLPSPAPKISAAEALGKADEAYHRREYTEAMDWYRKAADQGSSQAQNSIGWLYQYGQGVAQDYGEAMHWYRLAAEQENVSAQSNIGRMYESGWGVTQDYSEAMRWFRIAADRDGVRGQINVGRLYETGRGVPQDYAEAMRWYRKAADQGDAAAQYRIGWLYENGWGVSQDYGEAGRWYRKAVNQGDAAARAHVGQLYMRWYREAADRGDASAQTIIGQLFETGWGREPGLWRGAALVSQGR